MKKPMIKAAKSTVFLDDAIVLYKQHWEMAWQGHEYKRRCDFDGSIKDLEMLDYCEYEIGHPESDFRSASFIWGNVIQKNTDLQWGISEKQVCLYTDDAGLKSFRINVHAYIAQIIESQISQSCSFSVATEKLLLDMLLSNYNIENLTKLQEIVLSNVDAGNDSYSSNIAYAAGIIYKDSEPLLSRLHEELNSEQKTK